MPGSASETKTVAKSQGSRRLSGWWLGILDEARTWALTRSGWESWHEAGLRRLLLADAQCGAAEDSAARQDAGVVPVQRWKARNREFGSSNPSRKLTSAGLIWDDLR